jgi:hypothetical protein
MCYNIIARQGIPFFLLAALHIAPLKLNMIHHRAFQGTGADYSFSNN